MKAISFKHFLIKLKDHGQTSVEYILLLVVVIFMIINIMSTVRDRLLGQQNPCPPNDTSIGCNINRAVSSFGTTDESYRFFRLRR